LTPKPYIPDFERRKNPEVVKFNFEAFIAELWPDIPIDREIFEHFSGKTFKKRKRENAKYTWIQKSESFSTKNEKKKQRKPD
jgi:hypothetical protein